MDSGSVEPTKSENVIPLPNAGTHIRLLRLDFSKDGALLGASMSTATIDDPPEYIAISYTWGDPTPCHSLMIDGWDTPMTENCWFIFRQLCNKHHYRGLFWIDAISINQGDDAEKSAQVAMMHRVYKGAKETWISLGPGSEGDGDALKAARIGFAEARDIKQTNAHDGYVEGDIQSEDLEKRKRARLYNQPYVKSGNVPQALLWLSDFPYWTRLWIIQELMHSASARILLDGGFWPLDEVYYYCETLWYCTWAKNPLLTSQSYADLKLLANSRMWSVLSFAIRNLTERYRGLSRLLKEFRHQKCSDPRDYIFAMASFVEWPSSSSPPAVDYSLSAFDMTLVLLKYYKRHLDSAWEMLNLARTLQETMIKEWPLAMTIPINVGHRRSADCLDEEGSHTFTIKRCLRLSEAHRVRETCVTSDNLSSLGAMSRSTNNTGYIGEAKEVQTKRSHDVIPVLTDATHESNASVQTQQLFVFQVDIGWSSLRTTGSARCDDFLVYWYPRTKLILRAVVLRPLDEEDATFAVVDRVCQREGYNLSHSSGPDGTIEFTLSTEDLLQLAVLGEPVGRYK